VGSIISFHVKEGFVIRRFIKWCFNRHKSRCISPNVAV
jgi:hypothetical protein